jgi:ketosteroid isomerase-like protein
VLGGEVAVPCHPQSALAGLNPRPRGFGFRGQYAGQRRRWPGPARRTLAVIRELVARWNAGDIDGVVALYADDGAVVTSPDWPEPGTWRGREEIRASIEDWREVWQSSTAELERIEPVGDKVLAIGAWISRGRASGVDGQMPIAVLFTVRDGKIALHEWFMDHDGAIAAARGD